MSNTQITRESIAATYQLIRSHIRRTPVVEADGRDFGLNSIHLIFKLELLQHSGSFKARGAFTNLLTRTVPPAGVVAPDAAAVPAKPDSNKKAPDATPKPGGGQVSPQ